MTTGERIRDRRKHLGISAETLAQRCGISPATIYRYENGDIEKVGLDKLPAIARALLCTQAYLMGWDDEDTLAIDNLRPMPGTRSVPRLGAIACGEPILAQDNIEGYDQVPDYVKCDFTLTCKGDSMTGARIFDGDTVCIRSQPEVESGQIAAVLIEGEYETGATLKRVSFQGDTVILMPENPNYPPMVFSGADVSKVRILGLATHFISKVI